MPTWKAKSRTLRGLPVRGLSLLGGVLLAACATAPKTVDVDLPDTRNVKRECLIYAETGVSQPSPREAPAQQVTALTCIEKFTRLPTSRRFYVQAYARREQVPGAVDAAILAVACVADGACQPGGEPEAIGHAADALRDHSTPQVADAVRALPLAPGVAERFLERFAAARKTLDSALTALDPRVREVWFDLPQRTRARKTASSKAQGVQNAKIAKIVAGITESSLRGQTPVQRRKMADDLSASRAEAWARCFKTRPRQRAECVHQSAVRPLTEALLQISLADGDIPGAWAEAILLSGMTEKWGSLPQDIAREQDKLVTDAAAQLERYQEAVDSGVDEATLRKGFGPKPPVDMRPPEWALGAEPVAAAVHPLVARLDRHARAGAVIRGTVRSVRALAWDNVLVALDGIEGVLPDPTGCGDGGVDVPADEEDVPAEPEAPSPACRAQRSAAPVHLTVPETKGWKPGLRVELALDAESRRGSVVRILRGRTDEPVQVRGFKAP